MVKKKARPASGTRRPRRKLAKAPRAAPSGPLSLEQARALAQTILQRDPRSAAKAPKRKSPAQQASPATLGLERRRLERARHKERQQRQREYALTLDILQQRGVKGLARPARKGGSRKKARRADPQQPLRVLAEGDSWFDYPVPFFGGGVIPRLEKRLGVPILNLAKAGDEVRFMLGVTERKDIVEQLSQGAPDREPWDVLLFSGGGNDIVGDPLALWLRDFDPELEPAQLIREERFAAVLRLVRAGYEDLIELRDTLSPTTQLVFHAYDFALPDGRGICHLGPWLKPAFDLHGFPDLSSRFEVTRVMLQRFAAMLVELGQGHERVLVIDKQGKLPPATKSWHNELHPSKDGFNVFASVFYARLKALFPTRVLDSR